MTATTYGLDLPGAILGALVLEGIIPDDIRPLLTVDLFSGDRKVQAKAIFEANDTLGATDPVSVQRILARQDAPLDMILDIVRLAELVFSSAHLAVHIQLLREQVADAAPPLLSQYAEDFLSGSVQPVQWAVDSIWVKGNSGPLAGPEKVGKTWLAHELVLSLSTGTPFLGTYRVARPHRVLYWEEEDSRERTKRRGVQLLKGRGRARAQCEKTLRYLVGHGLKIDTPEGYETIRREIESFKPEFVVVGNLREVHSKDENRPEMSKVRDAFRTLTRSYGCGFVLIHHFRKTQEGQSKRGSQMLAGSGVWGAWAESWIYVTPGRTDDVCILEVGSKDADCVGQLIIQRVDAIDTEPLAEDAAGRKLWPVTLSVITAPDPEERGEDSASKIVDAISRLVASHDDFALVKDICKLAGVSRRTFVTHIPELMASGRVRSIDLRNGRKGYMVC